MILILFGFCLASTLLLLSVIDLKTMTLPDYLTLPLTFIGLGFGYWQHELKAALVGAALGYICLLAIEIIYKSIRGTDGIGRGDAKLLAAGGAWCGWYGLPFIILIASAAGLAHALLLAKRKDQAMPFGPHLSIGIFLTWLAIFGLAA